MEHNEKIKILVLTDIHSDYDAAKMAYESTNPDLVLDCGDHTDIRNISGLTPHYFVHGNHEPTSILLDSEGYPLPAKINSDQIYSFEKGELKVRFSGVGGNYSSRKDEKHINEKDIPNLKSISAGGLDVLLFHESPLNILEENNQFPLAQKVIDEIKRIRPKFVFSGHTGIYSENNSGKVHLVNLMDAGKGFGILEIDSSRYNFSRVISRYR
ncbi:metallophosphoesterase [Candidatus Pacearchaeota archaeon]|nr:metallophosphoesterase [Candidatus Pacearchaeota archaeon]